MTAIWNNPANIYLFKAKCEICSKLTIKHQKNINDIVLMSLLSILNIFHTCFSVSTVDFEQVFAENKMNVFPKSALLH